MNNIECTLSELSKAYVALNHVMNLDCPDGQFNASLASSIFWLKKSIRIAFNLTSYECNKFSGDSKDNRESSESPCCCD